ncbi:MAG: PPOX class F420-dependent oxidoreductase, partial [Gaiellaceae bacterium]
GTLNPDGRPQINPMWIDREDETVVINTAIGRQKEKNLRRDGRVTLAVTEPDNPYQYVEIRGDVVEFIEGDEAEAGIDKLAKKYIGEDKYPWRQEGERRVKIRIEPTYVYHLQR